MTATNNSIGAASTRTTGASFGSPSAKLLEATKQAAQNPSTIGDVTKLSLDTQAEQIQEVAATFGSEEAASSERLKVPEPKAHGSLLLQEGNIADPNARAMSDGPRFVFAKKNIEHTESGYQGAFRRDFQNPDGSYTTTIRIYRDNRDLKDPEYLISFNQSDPSGSGVVTHKGAIIAKGDDIEIEKYIKFIDKTASDPNQWQVHSLFIPSLEHQWATIANDGIHLM